MTRTVLCIFAALAVTITGCLTTGTTPGEGSSQGPSLSNFMGNFFGKLKGTETEEAGAGSGGKPAPGSFKDILDQEEKALTQRFADAGGVSVQRLDDAVAIVFMSDTYFDVDASDIKSDSSKDLEYLAELLKRYPDTRVEISCFTDSSGSEQHNLTLSQQRAQAVAELLTRSGVDSSRIDSHGYGETNFVASNATENGRKMNRRLTFIIIPIGVQSLRNPPVLENGPPTLSMRVQEPLRNS